MRNGLHVLHAMRQMWGSERPRARRRLPHVRLERAFWCHSLPEVRCAHTADARRGEDAHESTRCCWYMTAKPRSFVSARICAPAIAVGLRGGFSLLQCAELGFGEKSRSCNEFIAASKFSGSRPQCVTRVRATCSLQAVPAPSGVAQGLSAVPRDACLPNRWHLAASESRISSRRP